MSKIALEGNASGIGTFTISAPNGNTDRTLVLPDEAGTVLTSGSATVLPKGVPLVRVLLSGTNQVVTGGTWTKVQFNNKEFDTNNFFDATTNYRFQPTIAGYYLVSAGVMTSSGAHTALLARLYKNSIDYGVIGYDYFASQSLDDWHVFGSSLVYFNGSTDYAEIYGYILSSSPHFYASSTGATTFEAILVRAD